MSASMPQLVSLGDEPQSGYGAIAFYLDHQTEIDKYLEETEREFEGNAIPLEQANPELRAKIQRAKSEW